MKKILLLILFLLAAALFSLIYLEFPLNLIRPVFHADTIDRYAGEYGLDPLLITSVIKVESNFFRRARSHRGAVGLMQILPSTAKDLAEELGYDDFSKVDLEDPDTNIRFGSFYIKKLTDEFDGNTALAVASYNAGKTKVKSWYAQNPLLGLEPEDIPYRETRNYVINVSKTYRWLTRIKSFANKVNPGKKTTAGTE